MTREPLSPVPAAPQLFSNGEFEVAFIPDGDSYRVNATLVARQLGHREAYDLIRTLDDDEKVLVKGGPQTPGPSDQGVWFLTEPGFYKAVGQRNTNLIKDMKVRDFAIRFQRWVFHEVVPTMVRTSQDSAVALVSTTWSWDDVAAEVRQRYGLDYKASEITRGLRAAGWLKAGSTTPKHEHRWKFWHTGTAYHLLPPALSELVTTLVPTMQQLGDPQANQFQLNITPALKALPGGDR
ncbi:antirepressor [Gordonia phage Squiddly]|nr:antirepressor [Gordonia phage Squiddly]